MNDDYYGCEREYDGYEITKNARKGKQRPKEGGKK
jgi:hypothetical protein